MNKYQQAYEKAERKAISAHSTAVAMCNERAWVIADRAGKAAEQAYQTWMEHKDELYPDAHADAAALTALAATLDNGSAFAAQVCRKAAEFIMASDGANLDLRLAELQRLPPSYPETAEVINGLALMKRHERLPIRVCCEELRNEFARAGGVA
jgi:hypothetical protein